MQSFNLRTSLLVLLISLIAILHFSCSHPVYQHRFNNIVNSNPCLKKCMDEATLDDLELSLLKTANFSGYLLNLNKICNTISIARACIDSCGVDSNPFALESMNEICTPQALSDVTAVRSCLAQKADGIIEQCKDECGDYDQINNHVYNLTEEIKPDAGHLENKTKVADVMTRTNDACGILKCSNRCSAKRLTEECEKLEDERTVGGVIRTLIERVLVAQRRDLEKMKLVDTMAKTIPPHCNFLYMPDSMFNQTKDAQAMSTMEEARKIAQKPVMLPNVTTGDNDLRKSLNKALSKFQAHFIRKQLHLLDLQEQNMVRESQKLDLELQLLAQKRMQSQAILDDALTKHI